MDTNMRSSCLHKSSQRSSSNYTGCGYLRILKWTCLSLVCIIEDVGLDWDTQLRHAHRYTFIYACLSTGYTLQSTCASAKSTQSCLTLCDPMDSSPACSSLHGILQARILEWVVIPFSRGSSQMRDWTQVSCIAGGFLPCEPPGKPIKVYTSHIIHMEREGLIQSGA